MKPRIDPRYIPYFTTIDQLVVDTKTAGILEISGSSFTVNLEKRNHGEIAFHYCPKGTWEKIIHSKCLWMSDHRKMNDPTEGAYCRNKIVSRIFLELPEMADPKETFSALQRLIFRAESEPIHYVLSLSLNGNLLPQWREYAKEGGVSLGVSLSSIEAYEIEHEHIAVYQVEYDPIVQYSMIEDITEEIIEIIRNEPGSIDDVSLPEETLSRLCYLSLRMKHPAYASETEIRVVSNQPIVGKYKRTQANGTEIEYTTLALDDCILAYKEDHLIFPNAFVAPGPTEWETETKLTKSLKENNATGTTINLSGLPYHWG